MGDESDLHQQACVRRLAGGVSVSVSAHLLYGSAASRRPSPRKLSADDRHHHGRAGRKSQGAVGDGPDVLRLAQQHAPRHGVGGCRPKPKEATATFPPGSSPGWPARCEAMMWLDEARQHVPEDDAPFGRAVQAGGGVTNSSAQAAGSVRARRVLSCAQPVSERSRGDHEIRSSVAGQSCGTRRGERQPDRDWSAATG